MKRLLPFIAALILATGTAPAQTETLPGLWDLKEQLPKPDLTQLPRLRFLTTTDFPPFNFLDGNMRLSGFHVDLARAICSELKITERCQIQALPWEELQPALETGDGEAILAGISVTAQARATYGFTRPYMVFPARFVTLRNSTLAEPLARQIDGRRVGVLAGSSHENMLRAYFKTARPVTYDRVEWMYGDLKEGKLDALFGDGMKFSAWLASAEQQDCCRFVGGPYLSAEYLGHGLAIATTPENRTLVEALNYALQSLSAKGTMTELYLRYFPVGFF